MKKKEIISRVIKVLLHSSLVVACLIAAFAPSPAAAATATSQKIKIKASGAPAALAWYPAAIALHGFINQNSKLDITTYSTGGPLQITAAVVQGAADIGLQGVNNVLAYAYRGIYQFEGRPTKNLRNLLLVGGMYVSMLTVPKTGMKNFYDIRGKRVAWYTASTNDYLESWLIVHGIDHEKDITKVKVPSMAECHVELGLGRLDVGSTALLPSKSLLELQQARGIRFLPVEKEKVLEAKSKFPNKMSGIVPGLFHPRMQPALKIKEPIPVFLFPIGVACLDSLNEEAAYLYVKTMLENEDKIKALNPVLKAFSFERSASTSFEVPYHEGAIRAFKEKGLWTDQQEQFQREFFK